MPTLRTLIAATVLTLGVAVPAGAQMLPPTVRACIGVADAAERLACYDREVARLVAPAGTFAPSGSVSSAPPMAVASAVPKVPATTATRHLSGKVSLVHQSTDHMVVTLESGDVWEQSAPATSQVNVHPGDVVHLDYEIGGWFLSNRYGDSIQVKRRQP